MSSSSKIPMYIAGMVLFGCLNTETTKIQFTLSSRGLDGELKPFHKPWQAVFTMFMAMDVVLVYHILLTRRTSKIVDDSMRPLISASPVTGFRRFLVIGMPATFDLLGTGFGMVGFVYLPASINQMLRGSTIVFSAVFSVLFLKKRMLCYNWCGVLLCVIGICLVAASTILGAPAADADSSKSGNAFFGMCMNLLGQVFAASQIITEELMLKKLKIPPMQVVGYEGLWGTLLMVFIVFPVLYYLPGEDNGSMENFPDTLEMFRNNHTLLCLICLYIFSCSTYNIAGQLVTKSLSAVHRTMLEASRTMFIWLINLGVHYFVDPSIGFGEAWTPYSYLQLLGFLVVMCGQSVYGGLLRIPGVRYEDEKMPIPTKSPAAMNAFAGITMPGGKDGDDDDLDEL